MKRSVVQPEALTFLRDAYDYAWGELKPRIGNTDDEIENAKLVLARIILDCPTVALISRGELKRVVLREYEKRTFGNSGSIVRH